jgi:hypothetical protein
MKKIFYRKAIPLDIENLIDTFWFLVESEQLPEWHDPRRQGEQALRRYFEQVLVSPNLTCLVFYRQNEQDELGEAEEDPIGFVCYEEQAKEVMLWKLIIRPDAVRQKWGEKIFQLLFYVIFPEQKLIKGSIAVNNKRSQAFFESFGAEPLTTEYALSPMRRRQLIEDLKTDTDFQSTAIVKF